MKNKDIFDRDFSQTRIRFLSLKAINIYYSMIRGKPLVIENGKNIVDRHFSNLMPPNLDLIYLNEKGKLKVYELGEDLYSYDLVKVDFKLKKYGFDNPKDLSKTMREYLYLNGFVLNGNKYVRYKRSASAAKNNTCIFIKESLFNLLNKWSMTGLNLEKDNCLKSLTSFEAYNALSISDLVSTLKLNPYNILFVEDCKVILKDETAIRVSVEDKHLTAKEDKCDIENNIFDGEGLLDASVFNKTPYKHKGMILLRNRFFKCCAFNTKLQKWFKENNITSVDQLGGLTFAKSVKDIVLVVSESCLKYLKMCNGKLTKKNIKKWCDAISKNDESLFGIVKTDKSPRFFGGLMVETTYQFINTIKFKATQLGQLLIPYYEYIGRIHDITNHPEFIRYYFEGGSEYDRESDEDEEDSANEVEEYTSYSFKNKVCLDLMKIDKDVVQTSLFKDQVFDNVIENFRYRIFNGRLLVDGTNATLFGNPYEFLNYIILKDGKRLFDKDTGSLVLGNGEIYCPFFGDGEELVGMRSPHTTMGNLLYAKNKYSDIIRKWFNLSYNIVVVDAINNNIQYRLSGCDYDSDFMLLTNNNIIRKQVLENYDKFPVPYSDYEPRNKEMKNKSKDQKENILLNLVDIDEKIAGNNVGQIVNLSQLLNSHLWNNFKKGFDYKTLYSQIALLSVLSGAEIDSAKRTFPFDTEVEYRRLSSWAKKNGYLKKKPLFFAMLSNYEGRLKTKEIKEIINENKNKRFSTGMDILWIEAATHAIVGDNTKTTIIPFMDLIGPVSTKGVSKATLDQIAAAFDAISETRDIIAEQNQERRKKKDYEKTLIAFKDIIYDCYLKIKFAINNPLKTKLLIKKLDKENKINEKGNPVRKGDQLLFILFFILSIKEDKLSYSLNDLFKPDSVGAPTLKKAGVRKNGESKPFIYTFFGSHHFNIDDADYAIRKVLKNFKK